MLDCTARTNCRFNVFCTLFLQWLMSETICRIWKTGVKSCVQDKHKQCKVDSKNLTWQCHHLTHDIWKQKTGHKVVARLNRGSPAQSSLMAQSIRYKGTMVFFIRSLFGTNILEGPIATNFCGKKCWIFLRKVQSMCKPTRVTHSRTLIFIIAAAGTSYWTSIMWGLHSYS
jgi:hypothetical protein